MTFNANAHTNSPVPHVTAECLLYVLEGWQGQDDWSMPTYPYPETIAELLDELHAGDNPRALRLMGKAMGWKREVLYRYAPAHHAHAIAEVASFRAAIEESRS